MFWYLDKNGVYHIVYSKHPSVAGWAARLLLVKPVKVERLSLDYVEDVFVHNADKVLRRHVRHYVSNGITDSPMYREVFRLYLLLLKSGGSK